MKQTINFETRFGTLTIQTSEEIDKDQLEEVREQLELCSNDKSNVCRLGNGEEGSAVYVDGYYGADFTFNAKKIYPSRWIDNLFKIIYQIISTKN